MKSIRLLRLTQSSILDSEFCASFESAWYLVLSLHNVYSMLKTEHYLWYSNFLFMVLIVENLINSFPFYQSIGAVNTIVKRPSDGKLVGYNTDCEASITAIEDALKGNEFDT